jgi:hypothetical protein
VIVQRLTLAVVLVLFAAAAVSAANEGDLFPCDGSVADVATVEVMNGDAQLDVYITTGRNIEVKPGNIFKVYRSKSVPSGTEPVMIYIGRLEILSVHGFTSVGRAVEFAPRDENPQVRYETVMVGDCVVRERLPVSVKEQDGRDEEAKTAFPAQPPGQPPRTASRTAAGGRAFTFHRRFSTAAAAPGDPVSYPV